jgi:hypothetical protein
MLSSKYIRTTYFSKKQIRSYRHSIIELKQHTQASYTLATGQRKYRIAQITFVGSSSTKKVHVKMLLGIRMNTTKKKKE